MLEAGVYRGAAEGLTFQFRLERNSDGSLKILSGDITQGNLFIASFVCDKPMEEDTSGNLVGDVIYRGHPGLFTGSIRMETDERNVGSFQLSVDMEGGYRDIFAGRLEWISSLLRRMIIEIDGIEGAQTPPSYTTRDGTEMTIEEAFKRVGFDVFVHVDPFQSSESTENQMRGYSLAEIHAAMEELKSETPADRFHVHVFVCSYLAGRNNRGVLGIMYDFGEADINRSPREGVAIFHDHPLLSDPRVSEAERRREYVFTAVHEIGHALNLMHSFDKARPSALSWMNYPHLYPRGREVGTGYDGTAEFWRQFEEKFDDEELEHLHHATPREILPGGLPFGVYEEGVSYPFGGAAEPRHTRLGANPMRIAPDLKLELALPKSEYELGEPIFAGVRVTKNRSSGSAYVPDALDPMEGYLRIIIRRPDGGIVHFNPPVRLCKQAQFIHMPPGTASRSHETPIFLSAAGPEFTSPGTYKVSAEMTGINGSQVVYSQPITVRIATPDHATEDFVKELWKNPKVLHALYLRHPLIAPRKQWDYIEGVLKETVKPSRTNTTWSHFNYIAALGWMNPFAKYRDRELKKVDLDKATKRLKEVDPKYLPKSVQARLDSMLGTKKEKEPKVKFIDYINPIFTSKKEQARADVPPSGLFGGIGLDGQKELPRAATSPFVRVAETLRGRRRFADIVSWNIEHLHQSSRWEDIPEISELIRNFACDFWGLQEVDEDSMKELSDTINRNGTIRYAFKVVSGGGQQSGALYRTDTTSARLLEIPEGFFDEELEVEMTDGSTKKKKVFYRTPLLADVRVRNGGDRAFDFRCAVVHLKSTDSTIKDKGNALREAGARELARWIAYDRARVSERDYLILGDMNAETANQGLKGFTEQEDLKLLSVGMQDKYGNAEALTRVASKRLLDHIVVTDEAMPLMPAVDKDEQIIIRSDKKISDWTDEYSDHVPVAVRFIIGVDRD